MIFSYFGNGIEFRLIPASLVLLFASLQPVKLQAQQWEWAENLGTAGSIGDMAVDSKGNIYIASSGWGRITLYKCNPDGKILWKKFSGHNAIAGGLAIDHEDNLYLGAGGLKVTWGTDTLNPEYASSVFVAKLTPEGEIIKVIHIAEGKGDFNINDFKLGDGGALYITGVMGTAFYTAKCSNDGTLAWYKTLSGPNYASGPGHIGIDAEGNCYITGHFGTNWYPRTLVAAKYTADGTLAWQVNADESEAYGLDVRRDGSMYFTSNTQPYLRKHTKDGTSIWEDEEFAYTGTEVETDAVGNIYCIGIAYAGSGSNLFYRKFDEKGDLKKEVFVKANTGSTIDFIRSARTDGKCYVCGMFLSEIQFDQALLATASPSIFLAKIDCGFADNKKTDELFIYPNPFNDHATIVMPAGEEEFSCTVYSIRGQVVQQYDHVAGALKMERAELSPGIYLIRVMGKYGIQTKKMVVY